MIERDPRQIEALLALNAPPDQIGDFSATLWLSDPRNIALRIEQDLAMFEYIKSGISLGHIWFHSRGRKAFTRARVMLDYMAEMGVNEIIGEVPSWRADVQRFIRKLGFDPIGVASRPMGKVIVFQTANPLPRSLVA